MLLLCLLLLLLLLVMVVDGLVEVYMRFTWDSKHCFALCFNFSLLNFILIFFFFFLVGFNFSLA